MTPLLQAARISVRLSGHTILRDVNIELRPSELVVIAGPNGSGKSTLLRVLAGILPASAGQVQLQGKPLASYSRRDIARTLSYVPQDTRVDFGFTVREIVAMGRHSHMGRFSRESTKDRDAIERGLNLCDIEHLRHRQINSLSGGERQRVLIARCLAAEPSCILLDEPTASLDLEHALAIFALARRLAESGCAVAFSTHDLNNGLRFGSSALILKDGRVAYAGSTDDTLQTSVIESVFGVCAERLHSASGVPHYLFHHKE
jgi:iron complex transport system ATP-binding protein